MSANFERALLLFEQSRFAQAEAALHSLLGEETDNAQAQALLALTLERQQRYAEATETAQQAIAQAPDLPFAHYVLADVHYHREQLAAATAAIQEALRLDPENASFYSLQASILISQQRWSAALAAAAQGLAIDGSHRGCQHLRSLCLKQLNRLEEAAVSIETSLRQNPEDALGHANQGWLWLERGQPFQAEQAFQAALRLQPDLDWARRGMIQALKAANPIYGAFLRYTLWMSKLSEGKRWLVIAVLLIGFRLLRLLAQSGALGMVIAVPLIGLYISFVLFSWIADPLFNLLLRLNRYGRLLLSPQEISASNWAGGLLVGALLCGLAAVGWQSGWWAVGSAIALGLIIPAVSIAPCEAGWPRQMMTTYTLVMAAVGLLGWGLLRSAALQSIAIGLLITFGLGFMAASFVANILINRIPEK
jgi:tetratricopeptide (TPR) repeat protein